ncbi:hypothetical protein [Yersinia frederiksenii]|uniref:hypothetical protein n=1 Tax=Yersinia frederiksenii TaxID=29484 RepID=UPI0005DE1DE1|nr:hypothetical protein [Yersinia frederiksenii]CNK94652.1 Uncharacterised protein [Yersinia frederiksenii]
MTTLRQQLAEMQKELNLSVQAGKASQIIDKCNLVYSKTSTIAEKFALLKQQYPAQQHLPREIGVIWNDEQRSELIAAANSVKSLKLQWGRWLKNQSVDNPGEEEASQESLDETLTASEEPTAYDIIQNDSLTNCLSQLGALHKDLSKELEDAWDAWLEELHQQVHVDNKTLNLQKKANKFDDIAYDYERQRQDFENLAQSQPVCGEKIHQIKALAEKLYSLRSMMKTDWPDAVQAFFNRINGPQSLRPTLSALTPEVLEWLRDEEMLDEFVITRK